MAKSSTQAIIETVDIYPTLADLAALPAPSGPYKIDGQNFASVLKGEKKQIRNHAYHVYPKTYMGRAIRTDRYRMVEWKSKKNKGVYYELYDYQIDPLRQKISPIITLQFLKNLRPCWQNTPKQNSSYHFLFYLLFFKHRSALNDTEGLDQYLVGSDLRPLF